MATRLYPGSPPMRWVPTAAVLLAPIGCALDIVSRDIDNWWLGWAGALPALCLVIVCVMATLQPRPLSAMPGAPLDEREVALRWKAYARGLALTCLLGMLICFYMAWGLRHGWQQPSQPDWQNLFVLVICWFFGMPVAFANWMVGKPLDDEDDQ